MCVCVCDGDLFIGGASQLYGLPFSALHGKVITRKAIAAGLNAHAEDKIGHPTVLKKHLVSESCIVEKRGSC